jgi:hypothetical protein
MRAESQNQPPKMFDPFVQEKKADRDELSALPADVAQAAVEQILHPRLWQVKDTDQLAWQGDLADDD